MTRRESFFNSQWQAGRLKNRVDRPEKGMKAIQLLRLARKIKETHLILKRMLAAINTDGYKVE